MINIQHDNSMNNVQGVRAGLYAKGVYFCERKKKKNNNNNRYKKRKQGQKNIDHEL